MIGTTSDGHHGPTADRELPVTRHPGPPADGSERMRLRYGLNEADSWWHFAAGPHREAIWARLRALRPQIVRIFVFDKGAPDPVDDWPMFARYVGAVLN